MGRLNRIMKHNKTGFTLLEVLLVISTVGLLSSAVFVGISRQIKKSHDAKRKTDIHELQVALELYFTDNQRYPDQLIFNGQPLTSADGQTIYLNSIPRDPKNVNPSLYVYNATPSGQASGYDICAYKLEAVTENPAGDESFCLTNRQ